jgi:hypothetical protein
MIIRKKAYGLINVSNLEFLTESGEFTNNVDEAEMGDQRYIEKVKSSLVEPKDFDIVKIEIEYNVNRIAEVN